MAWSANSDHDSFSMRPPELPDSRRSYAIRVKSWASVSSGCMPFHTPAVDHFSIVASKPPGASMSSGGPEPRTV